LHIGSRVQLVVLLSLLVGTAVLVFDLSSPLGIAAGVPYVALVLIGLVAQQPRVIIFLAVVGSILTVVGYFFSPSGGIHHVVLINRGLALFAIWATAIISYIHLKMLARLEPMATRDQLTKLFNRHYFTFEIVKQINFWRRHQQPLSVLMLDVDHFKNVNDTYGHLAGDYALQAVASICIKQVRDIDTVARIGGEEIAILLPSTAINGALQMAERIRADVEAYKFKYENAMFELTVSIGVVELTDETWSVTELLKAVDEMLYKAKNSGRNHCVARNIG